ncbi:hypothetical protein CBS101457_001544 [Exobasidium rhododendri]|nr:hypothetical protein CBS101457_001544 [Exobasidium rhododendri]
MTTMAGYGQPLGALPAINAGPSIRQNSGSSKSPVKQRKQEPIAAARQIPQVKPAKAPTSSSPSKKKITNMKSRLPEVGPTIRDIENGVVHITGKMLGQGGFAKVYQVQGSDGKPMAFKAILKEALLNQRKNRQKVLAEILIHRSLSHANIVKFYDLFQDESNIYFKLELCSNGSMNDMVRARGRCLDEEARFYMVQLLAGCKYMHNNHVIHRDLKLGNIMLDADMNIKIGDFGLAALLKDPEERKKTLCGTPNYIAPEILYESNGTGHSFEVDVWSVGVILYTLLIGKPPFQTTSVPAIYEKIRKNDYSIPEYIHPAATDLIKRILTHDPSARPTLVQIMHHPWFTCGPIPLFIPSTGTKMVPHLTLPRTEAESKRNLQTVKELSGWRDDADDEIEDEDEEDGVHQSAKEKRKVQEKAEEERERMDYEFEKAIQPGSSLADFLQMGRAALVKAPAQTSAPLRSRPSTGLARQLSALSISRQHQGISPLTTTKGGGVDDGMNGGEHNDKENIQQQPASRMLPPSTTSARLRSESNGIEERRMLGQKARLVAAMSTSSNLGSLNSSSSTKLNRRAEETSATTSSTIPLSSSSSSNNKKSESISSMDVMIHYLGQAIECYQSRMEFIPLDAQGKEVHLLQSTHVDDAENAIRERPVDPTPYIVCWMDEMDKYGLGYALSDGTVGAYLKDDSSITANALRSHFDHISKAKVTRSIKEFGGTVTTTTPQRRENFVIPTAQSSESAAPSMPKEVLRKFKVLSYFEEKISSRLGGFDVGKSNLDGNTVTGMPFVWKWYRCLQAIVFRLSTGTIQFNFYDHTKVFLSQEGLVISAIVTDKTGEAQPIRSWSLTEFFSIADKTRSQREQDAQSNLALTTHEERKTVRLLVSKVRYARETLIKISTKDSSSASIASSNPASASVAATRSSKATTTSTATSLALTGSSASLASLGTQMARSGSGQSIGSTKSTGVRR